MGAWGVLLFQDDVAEEVRDAYIDLIKNGKTSQEATDELMADYELEIADPEDGPIFWFALADTQWRYGRLLDFVKDKALLHIRDGADLTRWEEEGSKPALRRRAVLEKLQEKLLSPMPKEKKFGKSRLFRCEWSYGDVYAYQMKSEEARACGLFGKYVLLRKVDEGLWHPGHIVPIVRLKIVDEGMLPKTAEEYDAIGYYMIWRVGLDSIMLDQQWPIDTIEGSEERKSIKDLIFDDKGFVPEYLLKFAVTSKKQIRENFIYLGNFPNVRLPENEFVPNYRINIAYEIFKLFESRICRFLEYKIE